MGEHPSRILVCGSRGWTDRVLRAYGPAVVVHGGARGADQLAGETADQLGWPVEVHPADWRHGRAAGLERNIAMLDTHPALVIAFTLDTPGTCHTIAGARRRGIPVVVVTPDHVIGADPTA